MLMDVDRFKEINDTLGHYNGDLLLKRVGPRLRSVLRDQDTVARLGGDEFAILLPGLPDDGAVTTAAERIIRSFEEPFVLGGLALEVEASVGVAVYPEHGNRVDVLLNRADTAMYAAKAARTGFAVYSDQQDQGSRRRLALAGEVRRAINEDEIVLNFQPKTRMPPAR
jgi:diguanylate cyclase (GGDEF)-like protein